MDDLEYPSQSPLIFAISNEQKQNINLENVISKKTYGKISDEMRIQAIGLLQKSKYKRSIMAEILNINSKSLKQNHQ